MTVWNNSWSKAAELSAVFGVVQRLGTPNCVHMWDLRTTEYSIIMLDTHEHVSIIQGTMGLFK
jgi:hypothetical protein